MMNSSLGDLHATENYYGYNDSKISTLKEEIIEALQKHLLVNFSLANMNGTADHLNYNYGGIFIEEKIIFSVVLIICSIGAPLNGIVIWLLGFQIKRNPFTVLILNLAIADFGFLIFMTISCINIFIGFIQRGIPQKIFYSLFNVTYINGLFLLTAISIDRCVAVLFPIWHRCSRPKYLSPAVCTFLWILSFLLAGISSNLNIVILSYTIKDFHLVMTAVLCLLLITISTVILFIKICLKSKQLKHGRILVMTFITVLCFLILTLPFYIYVFLIYFIPQLYFIGSIQLELYFSLFAPLNCSVNPVIYFLVGRKKSARSRESIKVIFQRVFREDEAP
ncbi:mas-related G-protein coupled receptor member H-like [Crotalus tigris]|uniref:mas-related G-protein coupled receptor member H-like n=1 Tax=Crotalus tigris TaxID=88082 RepID=UPI00192F18DB|nr:mas-related G-protein coupled receptor member H-like [Crotalus tigris]